PRRWGLPPSWFGRCPRRAGRAPGRCRAGGGLAWRQGPHRPPCFPTQSRLLLVQPQDSLRLAWEAAELFGSHLVVSSKGSAVARTSSAANRARQLSQRSWCAARLSSSWSLTSPAWKRRQTSVAGHALGTVMLRPPVRDPQPVPAGRSAGGPGAGEQGLDLGPEVAPGGPLALREFGERVGVANGGQVRGLRPVAQPLAGGVRGPGVGAGQALGVGGPIGPQPVPGAVAQAGAGRGVEGVGVLALAGAGAGGGAGGVVAVRGGERGAGGEGFGVERDGGGVELPIRLLRQVGQADLLGGAGW